MRSYGDQLDLDLGSSRNRVDRVSIGQWSNLGRADRVLVGKYFGKYFNPDLGRSLHDRYSTDPTPTRLILDRFPSGLLHDLYSNIFDMSKIFMKNARVMPTKDDRPDHSRRSSSINHRPHDRV